MGNNEEDYLDNLLKSLTEKTDEDAEKKQKERVEMMLKNSSTQNQRLQKPTSEEVGSFGLEEQSIEEIPSEEEILDENLNTIEEFIPAEETVIQEQPKQDVQIINDSDNQEDVELKSLMETDLSSEEDSISNVNLDNIVTEGPELNLDDIASETPDLNLDAIDSEVPELNLDEIENEVPDLDLDVMESEVPELNLDEIENEMSDLDLDLDTIDSESSELDLDAIGSETPDLNLDAIDSETPDLDLDDLSGEVPDLDLNLDALDSAVPDIDLDALDSVVPDLDLSALDDATSDIDLDALDATNTEEEDKTEAAPEEKLLDLDEADALLSNDNGNDVSDIGDETTSAIDSFSDQNLTGNEDVTEILDLLDDDSELSEINDLLKKSDNNEEIDDSVLDLLDDVDSSIDGTIEQANEDASINKSDQLDDEDVENTKASKKAKQKKEKVKKEKVKKEKKPWFKKANKKEAVEGTDGESGEAVEGDESEENPGLMSKFVKIWTEEDIEPEPTEEEIKAAEEAKAAKEQEVLDEKAKKKKEAADAKKEKAKAAAEAKKKKAEEAAKKKKEKEEAKAAKLAEKKAKEAEAGPPKYISRKNVAVIVLFSGSLLAIIIVSGNIAVAQSFLKKGRQAYYNGDYRATYENLFGENLNSSDQLMYDRAVLVMRIERKYNAYQNFIKMGKNLDALNSLIRGTAVYDEIYDEAMQLDVINEVDTYENQILDLLNNNYGVSKDMASQLLQISDKITYTKALNDIIMGENVDLTTPQNISDEEVQTEEVVSDSNEEQETLSEPEILSEPDYESEFEELDSEVDELDSEVDENAELDDDQANLSIQETVIRE